MVSSRRIAWDTHAVDIPDVRYVRAGGVAIAYQIVGEGPRDLLFSPHLCDLFTLWQAPHTRSFLEQLTSEVRLTVLNPRGTGLSDKPRNVSLEARMDDITAVLDDIGSERASLFGVSTSANTCALFAATYPERCERLVLANPYARAVRSEASEDEWLEDIREARDRWGEREYLENFLRAVNPIHAEDDESLEWGVWQQRLAVSPSAAADWIRMGMETDISDILSSIRAPTLVLYLEYGSEDAREVSDAVRDGRSLEVRSPYTEDAAEAILEFVRGATLPAVPGSVLATVLFTDLVGSTERAVSMGDKRWRDVLDEHHRAVRRELVRFRGVEIDTAGDGFFCRFDGPARAMACARAIVDRAKELELEVRSGIHTGECEIVGEKLAGIAVVTGARISSVAAPGEVLVSSTVKDLVAGSGFSFDDRGEHDLKGVPGTWRLYAVTEAS
jgi:class 3 adenylate cyclase/pimeloyl-ACP methyl ester carboxylesterase